MGVNLALSLVALLYSFSVISAVLKDDVQNYMGTRTPYRFRMNKNDTKIKFPHCKDTKIWMMIRHGTRLPSNKDIRGMKTTLEDLKYEILLGHQQGKGDLTKDQLDKLEEWTTNLDEGSQKFLTREGQDEMVQLAERMHKRFPNTIKNKYSNHSFLFRHTATERAHQSAKYFAIGLFDVKKSREVEFYPAAKFDPVLRFYKQCDKWQKQVKKNPDTFFESVEFSRSLRMNHSLEAISKRLGLDRVLDVETVNLMYKICGFETSWHQHSVSPWCFGFDEDSIKNLEYYNDLKHYWQDGYGHDLTYRQACISVKSMFEGLQNKSSPEATFLFAHSGTLLKVLAHFGLYRPREPLRADNVDHDRSWKTSIIDCFGSNLAFVLFKCKDGDHILTLHQERIIKLPMCKHELCPLNHLVKHFHDTIHKCNYQEMCSLTENDGASSMYS